MNLQGRFFLVILPLFLFAQICAAQSKDKSGVEEAMQKYDRLIMGMNSDSIAMIYAPDGELGKIAKGRDSIRNFLNTFSKFRVLSQSSETNTIQITGDSAVQTGIYHQTVIIPSKDTVTVKGNFTALWIWMYNNRWLIHRMETKPAS